MIYSLPKVQPLITLNSIMIIGLDLSQGKKKKDNPSRRVENISFFPTFLQRKNQTKKGKIKTILRKKKEKMK